MCVGSGNVTQTLLYLLPTIGDHQSFQRIDGEKVINTEKRRCREVLREPVFLSRAAPMSKQLDQIQRLLKRKGPLDSNDLVHAITQKGITSNAVAARKVIQRAVQSGLLQTSSPVRFDKTFLYYLEEHKAKAKGKRYSTAIKKLLTTKPSHNRVFKTLLANKGWITHGQIGKASACLPEDEDRQIGGRKSINKVVEDLLCLGIVEEVPGARHLYRLGMMFGSASIAKAAFLHKLRIEQKLLDGTANWLKNTYLIAHRGYSCRTLETEAEAFNQTYWDAHGPIYLGPFTRNSKLRRTHTKENFLTVDMLAYRTFSIVDADAAVTRYKNIVLRWKTIAITPIVVSRSFSSDAWNLLRSAGVGAVLLSDVFGKNIDALLQAMWNTISDSRPVAEQIDAIRDTLAIADGTIDQQGLVGNLKGTLFEFLIALAWKVAGYDITLQKVVRRMPYDEYEIDIVAIRSGQCKLIECKGHHAGYRESKDEVERHFANRCEAAADPYGWDVTKLHKEVEALFVTSGELDNDAQEYGDKTTRSHGITCTVQTRTQLMKWLSDLDQAHLCDILDRYYSHPQLTAVGELETQC